MSDLRNSGLTKNALLRIYHMNETTDADTVGGRPFSPVLECLYVKLMHSQTRERWKMILSDGTYYVIGVVHPDLDTLFHRGIIKKGTLFQLDYFRMCTMYPTCFNRKRGVKVLHVMDLTPLGNHLQPDMIGSSKDVNMIDMTKEVLQPL